MTNERCATNCQWWPTCRCALDEQRVFDAMRDRIEQLEAENRNLRKEYDELHRKWELNLDRIEQLETVLEELSDTYGTGQAFAALRKAEQLLASRNRCLAL